eukprot:1490859-Amphidinium_carterae.1
MKKNNNNGTSTRTWRRTLKRLTRTLRVTLRLSPSAPTWRKTKTGRRRARRGGSGGTRSSLSAVAEEKASDAFLETMPSGSWGLFGAYTLSSMTDAI